MSHRYEMYSVGNIVNNYINDYVIYFCVTRLMVVIILVCIEILNHCVM